MKLLDAAKTGAEWMREWLAQDCCECEGGHLCGRVERQKELVSMKSAICRAERQQNCLVFDVEFVGMDGVNHRVDSVRMSDLDSEVFAIEGRGGHSVVVYGWIE